MTDQPMTASAAAQHDPTRGSSGRGLELVLLAAVTLIVTVALSLVEVGQERSPTSSVIYLGVAYLALFGAAHLGVRRLAPRADPLILPCVALLNGLGLVMIHRLDLANATRAVQLGHAVPSADAPKQLVWTAIALILFGIVLWAVRDHRTLSRYAYTCGLLGLFLLVLPGLLPASISQVNGAKLWLRLGPVSIQPGEFAKVLVIIFAAGLLVAKRDLFTVAGRRILGMQLPRLRDLAPLLVAWMISVGVLAFEKELGASLLFFGVVLAMLYIATNKPAWLLVGLFFFVIGCVAGYYMFAHVRVRVEVWQDPFAVYTTGGYQVAQALFGLSSGGIFGTGLGAGQPELVPFANTDFISSTIGEELGVTGLTAVLMVYFVLISRGLRGALSVRDSFGKLLAGGMSFAIAMQVFVVVGGVTTLIPLTGMTMPFLSYGGSSLLANYILIALLLRISDSARSVGTSTTSKPPAPRPSIAEAHTEMVKRER